MPFGGGSFSRVSELESGRKFRMIKEEHSRNKIEIHIKEDMQLNQRSIDRKQHSRNSSLERLRYRQGRKRSYGIMWRNTGLCEDL